MEQLEEWSTVSGLDEDSNEDIVKTDSNQLVTKNSSLNTNLNRPNGLARH